MGALGAAGMLTVGLVAGSRIGVQQGYFMAENLQSEASETYDRYKSETETDQWGYKYTGIDGAKLSAANLIEADGDVVDTTPIQESEIIVANQKDAMIRNAAVDVPAVKTANIYGGRMALRYTAIIPACMALGFLVLLIYYRSIGGYKVLNIDGTVAEGHPENTGPPPGEGSDGQDPSATT
jgi:hypothetical protein